MEIRRILNEQLEPLIEWFVPEILNLTEPPNCNCSTIPKIVSCAIQTDVPDKVSCAVQTEVPVSGIEEENFKDDDWSSLGNREIPHGMSCAIQTEIPHGVSRAIQTEIPNGVSCEIQTEIPDSVSRVVQTVDPDSVIENENCEEVDWSSLDNKDVILLSECMKNLLNKGSDYDVKICVQNKEFRVHRNILSARSPVFAMMFAHDTKENNTGTISIEDCDPDTFSEFLLYLYSGRTENLTPTTAFHLYYTADKYDFPGLKERCVRHLKSLLSVESVCNAVLLAAKHQEKDLLEAASEFFAQNIEKILISEGWQTFMFQNPVEANELYIKSIKFYLPKK